MGGCPKAQIERDEVQVRRQSAFWQNNLDRIIREYVVASGRSPFVAATFQKVAVSTASAPLRHSLRSANCSQ
jgi:hypothetical protein